MLTGLPGTAANRLSFGGEITLLYIFPQLFPACIAVLSTLNLDCWFYWFIALSFPCCTSIIVSEMCSTTCVMKSTKVLNPRRCIMRHEKYACAYTRITHGKWPTVRMAVQRRECWISATEGFQRKPHIFFDLRCPLST